MCDILCLYWIAVRIESTPSLSSISISSVLLIELPLFTSRELRAMGSMSSSITDEKMVD
jgi:hypothetical protein